MSSSGIKRRWFGWGLIFGCWTIFAVFFFFQSYIQQTYWNRPFSWKDGLISWFVCAYLWAALTPLVLYFARKFPIGGENSRRALPIHFAASLLFSLLQLSVYVLVRYQPYWAPARPTASIEAFKNILIAEFHVGLIVYWAVVGISHALDYYDRYRDRELKASLLELKASQLETQLANAQLDALRAQLQPHFLFNTLNAISVLMQKDVQTANRMLLRLSDLLRLSLKRADSHLASLRQELDFLKGYLEIEQMRFQDRLTVQIAIDPTALDVEVPHLILQPIVENAVRHGVAERAGVGRILISAERNNGCVRLQVKDNGPGLKSGLQKRSGNGNGNGIGLSNTQARLEQLYGADHGFEMADAEEGGLVVTITIPAKNDASN